jgi:peptidoglycan/LPS O-acetylase OafA/YrhL
MSFRADLYLLAMWPLSRVNLDLSSLFCTFMCAYESTLGRIPALDGIRGLAISLVLWYHLTLGVHLTNHPHLERIVEIGRFTWSGVDLFFVLSGFLIGGILLDAARSPSYFPTFYIRRAYRILPLYVVLVVFVIIVVRQDDGTSHLGRLGPAAILPRYLFFLQNFWIAVTGSFGPLFLGITWSLAVEEQFYLTLPVAVRYVPQRILSRLLLGTVVAAPLLRILAVRFVKGKWAAAYVLMPCRSDALCLGVLIAMATRSAFVWGAIVRRRKFLYVAFALAVGLGLWMLAGTLQPFTTRAFELEYSLLAIIYSLLLLSTLVSPWLSWLFSVAPLRFLGVIAYGLYLFHVMLIAAFGQVTLYLYPTSHGATALLAAVLGVLASVGLATVSWYYFEKPLVKRGHRRQYWTPNITLS